jgi:hypothetical protein
MRQRGYNKMSLCYDFQKWIMISLASVAITLVIGLVSLAYGQTIEDQQKANCESIQGNCIKLRSNVHLPLI